jgi:acyltransferase
VLALAAGLSLVRAEVAQRVAFIGRRSLGVYLFHLPIVYGWGPVPGLRYRYGQTLGLGTSLAIALVLLVGGLGTTMAYEVLERKVRQALAPAEPVAVRDGAV